MSNSKITSKTPEELLEENGNLGNCLECQKPFDVQELEAKAPVCFPCKKNISDFLEERGMKINITGPKEISRLKKF
jgi:hypothetical protein